MSLKKSRSRRNKYTIPTRKISETIIEFGMPLLQRLPEDLDKNGAFDLIVSAWNAVVLDQLNNNRNCEKEFLDTMGPVPIEFSDIPEELIKRKKLKYSADLRKVDNYRLSEKNGKTALTIDSSFEL